MGSAEPVTVAEYLYRGDAEVGRAALTSAGISALIRADDEGGLNPGFYTDFRVSLQVNAVDLAEARRVLGIEPPLLVPVQIREAMLAHSRWSYPNEACGLLAGTDHEVALVVCLTNRLAAPTRYSIDPREHFGAARFAESCGWSILGAWHSHPHGDAELSATDVAESPGGSWITLVVGNRAKRGETFRAYRTSGDVVFELPLATDSEDLA